MSTAERVPTFAADGAPVSVLVDYDGTISLQDVGDELLARFFDDRAVLAQKDAEYDAGLVGSRDLMKWDMDVLPRDPDVLRATAAAIALDETLRDLVSVVRRHGAAVEVVSDGLGFYVEAGLSALSLSDVPVATNVNTVRGGGLGMTFPFGHPRCFVCGTCKRERVRVHQAAGRAVVYIGDGTSDRFAAAHADVIFAKGRLASLCAAEGWASMPWDRLSDVATWLDWAIASGELPGSRQAFEAWRADGRHRARPFICGPEVWGDDRSAPPATLPADPDQATS